MKTVKYAVAASVLITTSAMAGHDSQYNTQASYEYAKVVNVEPITRVVRTSTPRQECWEEEQAHYRRGYNSPTPTLIGSIIGGAIGNELGNNKDARKGGLVVGAILGGAIARDITNRNRHAGDKYYTTEEVCKTYQDYRDEERIVGYNVEYRYNGAIYQTETRQHPGKRIKLRVSVAPVEEEYSNTTSYRY